MLKNQDITLHPLKRFFRLLKMERKDIYLVYFYTILSGLISLSFPLGIQSIISFAQAGVFTSSLYIVVGVVILGLVLNSALQLMEFTIVERIQQRIFVKAGFEFSYRLSRFNAKVMSGNYAPELANRFFDIVTIQKLLPKLLLDFTAVCIQIFLGLLLLSLYHPIFIATGLGFIILMYLYFSYWSQKALDSSIQESKSKYKIVYWLEEAARSYNTFRSRTGTEFFIEQADNLTKKYLYYRQLHFKHLVAHFIGLISFKTIMVAFMLTIGAVLVVDKQMTIGQFVASEIVIVLLVGAIDKLLFTIDAIYDTLTSVDKVGQIMDLPLETPIENPIEWKNSGHLLLSIKNLSLETASFSRKALDNIQMEIESGDRVVFTGNPDNGQLLMARIIAGQIIDYKGSISCNQISYRDMDFEEIRDQVGSCFASEEIFAGTVLDNLTYGLTIDREQLSKVIKITSLEDWLNSLNNGLQTELLPAAKGLDSTTKRKIMLARTLLHQNGIIIIEDLYATIAREQKLEIFSDILAHYPSNLIILISNDSEIIKMCNKVYCFNKGEVKLC